MKIKLTAEQVLEMTVGMTESQIKESGLVEGTEIEIDGVELKESDEAQAAFILFTKELTKLTKKTGIAVTSTGGISYDAPNTIKSVRYSDDFSSGDLGVDIT